LDSNATLFIVDSKSMVYKRFSFQLYVRVALILIDLVILALTLTNESRFFSSIVFVIILIILLYELFQFINISNRQLARFLEAINHSDLTFTDKNDALGESFKELNQAFKGILTVISSAKVEKEAQYQYLKLIIDHIETGIIAIDNDSNITLFNSSALSISGIEEFSTYDKLVSRNPALADLVKSIDPNEKKLFEYKDKNNTITLSVQASKVKVLGKNLKIITFSNIASEIEQNEIDAWHKLIRTMAHEIINSVTPITSLTETCIMLLKDEEGNQKPLSAITEKQISSILSGLQTIEKRSDGLYNFVNDYRKLTKLPTPEKHTINVKTFLENVNTLMQAELAKMNILLVTEIPNDSLLFIADSNLIEQVVINLITNSIYALSTSYNPKIVLRAQLFNGSVIIEVEDNGIGIPNDIIDNIFIPFYTTKNSGSGIGLSLSRQIMKLHGGTISLESEPNVKTVFRLHFRQE